MTSGIISGLDRTIDGENGKLTGLLQTDAAINPGNSGGAARRPLRPAARNQHRRHPPRRSRERQLRDRDRRGAAGDREDPQGSRPTRRPGSGSRTRSVDSESAAVQLGLDASRARRRRHGRLPGRARREGGSGGRRRGHRRRRRADRLGRRPQRADRQPQARRRARSRGDRHRGPRLVTVAVTRRAPARYRRDVSPQRPSGRRFAAFLAALAVAASAFGALVLPRLADGSLPPR